MFEEQPVPRTLPELAEQVGIDGLLGAALKSMDSECVQFISSLTQDQDNCENWYRFCTGRITASSLFDATRKVLEDGRVSDKNTSFIKKIMNYSPPIYSPAVRWGRYNENVAIQHFFHVNRRHHRRMEVANAA